MKFSALAWVGSAATGITKALTKKRNTLAAGERAVKEAEAHGLKVKAENTAKELDIDRSITQQQATTWKDEYATLIMTAPLLVAFIASLVILLFASIAFVSGDLLLADYLDAVTQLQQLFIGTLQAMPNDYYYILGAVIFTAIGYRGGMKAWTGYMQERAASNQKASDAVKSIGEKLSNQSMVEVVSATRHPSTLEAVEHLVESEGYEGKPYPDSRGILTIWHGFNLEEADDPKLAKLVTEYKVDQLRVKLVKLDWFDSLDVQRQAGVIRAGYWLGYEGFINGFPKCIHALQCQNWQSAHAEFLDSKMGRGELNQDGGDDGMKLRCQRIAQTFLTGV